MDTILITGGLGRIGTALCQQLRGKYRTRSFDLRPTDEADENYVGNITDIPAVADACDGARAIVHLAGIPTNAAPFENLLDANIRGTYCVYEAARQAGVKKVVFASTNHVSGMWEQAGVKIPADAPVRPDSLYAVSKAAGEATARYFADEYGISSVCLRIGGFSPTDEPRGFRNLYMMITHRDMAQLVDKSIQSDVLFAIVNGISNHPKAYQELENAKRLIGYEPQDSGAEWVKSMDDDSKRRYDELSWRELDRDEMLHEWSRVRAK
ncbi:MAG: NAD(P)-dependent oxidoreductase [Candidatus Poribacteria bacterium]|nr:NAD(P)-dependent oxidoreductase [Candidatus Poribacteria bacterium]